MPSRLLKSAFAFAVLLLVAPAGFAQTPATVQLQDLTWTEFAERTAAGSVPIVLPLGSQEEQGPHAPMGDFVVAERIALAAAERGAGTRQAHCHGG